MLVATQAIIVAAPTGARMPKERRTWWTGGRSCYNANGAPKAAFASKRAAEKAIPKTAHGLHPYRCADHGWHLGHA